ncbi:MAG: hypothetical protein JNM56_36270 [Planctomycetia bacterium]|nr:hypothetical protein [Planctomycetia bacterium]
MLTRLGAAACALVLASFLVGGLPAADEIKSGPQVGERLPGPFHPLNFNGTGAGKKHCLYCEHGPNPVIMVLARDVSEPLTNLIKKLDAASEKNKADSLGTFVVFCNDDQKLPGKLKDLVESAKLKHTVLAVDAPVGPEDYKFVKQADVTVVLYVEATVKANHTFKKGEFKDSDIDKVLGDVTKILPKK